MKWNILGAVIVGVAVGRSLPGAGAGEGDAADTLRRVRDDIVNRHPAPPPSDTLTYGAIHGMVGTLDRWSRFYAPSEVSTLTEDPPDLGIDAETSPAECGLLVTGVSGVAAKAGLRAGDCIVTVDGAVLKDLAMEARGGRLLGSSRTASVLQVQRAGSGRFELVAVRRGWRGAAPLEVAPVPGSTLGRGPTWLRVTSFPAGMTDLWPRTPRSARPTVAPSGIVVDLRGNPGGDMSEAVRFVDRFATEGLVVRSVVRGEATREYLAHNDGDESLGPVAVLVDGGTASAAEITAAALRERVGAVVVGRPTVGKRAIETILRYEDGSALQLTIGQFEVAGGSIPIDLGVPEGAGEEQWVQAALGALAGYRPQ